MSLSLVPARVFSSYAAVTPEYLADRGVRLLLSDLDFTLAPKSCPAPDEAVRAWIASMHPTVPATPKASKTPSARPSCASPTTCAAPCRPPWPLWPKRPKPRKPSL